MSRCHAVGERLGVQAVVAVEVGQIARLAEAVGAERDDPRSPYATEP